LIVLANYLIDQLSQVVKLVVLPEENRLNNCAAELLLQLDQHGFVLGAQTVEHLGMNVDSELRLLVPALFAQLAEKFGDLAQVKLAYVGDGNNVCHSLMLTGAQLGANVTIATPRGYSPDIEIVTQARDIAQANGCELRLLQDPQAAVEGADAVYTDVCVSMGFEHESTKREPIFRPFQVNEALMAKATPHAVFMHCLPARRNAEVTDAVLDGPQSIAFDQAENRLHAQKALLLLLLGGLANIASFQ